MKNKKIVIGAVIAFIVVILIGSVVFYFHGISAVSSKSKQVIVSIKNGSGSSEILEELDKKGLVNNKLCGKLFLKLNSYQHLKANTYIFNKNMSLSEMYDIINNPDKEHVLNVKLTIKEGNTIPQVAQAFASILNISQVDVINQWADRDYLKSLAKDYWFIDESILNKKLMYPLEGYLYPETYYVTEEKPTLKGMTKLALDMMDKKLTPYKEDIQKLGWTSHQFLTFASIVERESLFDKDRAKIAGVFMNRLNKNMRLQSDITVNYAWQKTGVKVSTKQTQINSLYNTYKYSGLPVGPVSTVYEKTMDACINYSKADYYYFFATKDGTVLYSRTYEEHKKIVEENKWY